MLADFPRRRQIATCWQPESPSAAIAISSMVDRLERQRPIEDQEDQVGLLVFAPGSFDPDLLDRVNASARRPAVSASSTGQPPKTP